MKYFIVWIIFISVISTAVTVVDKCKAASKKRSRRVPESTLLWLSAVGGSLAMLITMFIIRHKTRKPKFMLGIPLIIAAQAALLYLIEKYGGGII